jgi:hypothetical protein
MSTPRRCIFPSLPPVSTQNWKMESDEKVSKLKVWTVYENLALGVVAFQRRHANAKSLLFQKRLSEN